jgi:hypothetical protein
MNKIDFAQNLATRCTEFPVEEKKEAMIAVMLSINVTGKKHTIM